MATETINIFIAYAREDAPYLQELRKHLRILERNRAIKIWYDGEIIAGEKWNEVIEHELEQADVFVLLLSADFINSDYAYGKEMEQALERHNKGEAILIPVVARACAWNRTPLAALQAPVQGKPLANVQGGARDQLYAKIVDAIAEVVEQLQAEKIKLRAYFADTEAWDNALTLSSISGYNRYLEQHPQGRHSAQAKKAIADIERKQQQEKENIERKAWQAAKQQNTIAAYRDYLQKYPKGRFVANANTAIQFIEQDRTRQAENAEREAYQAAKVSHSIAAYRQYLVNYPKGKYASAAQKAIRRLEQPPSPVNRKRVGLMALAILLLGVAAWQGLSFFGGSDGKDTDKAELAAEEQPDNTLEKDTTTIAPSEVEKPPQQEAEAPKPVEEIVLPLELTYGFGEAGANEIKATIKGGVAPYTLRLLKGKREKYSRAYNKAGNYIIAITTAYREDAGTYALEVEDTKGKKQIQSVKIDPPKPKPSPTTTTRPTPSTTSTAFKAPTLIRVAGGTFTMGCKEGRDKDCNGDEKPEHEVTLNTYYIGKYEVTNEEFCTFLNEKGNQEEGGTEWLELESQSCKIQKSGSKFVPKSGYAKHPVVVVSWYGARAYCKWISGKTGKNYRLPTEAEWEFAARGGNSSRNYLYSGSNTLGDVAWYSENSGSNTHPVGKKKANELEIHDMSGNVWEWCNDWYEDYSAGAQTNPKGPASGTYRVLRGGSWVSVTRYCRSSSRINSYPLLRNVNYGFRLVRA